MSIKYLLLWLEAPLQSWGGDSKFSRRDTLNFPTRSGVIGLILCALGASGEQRELLEQFSKHSQTVYSYIAKSREVPLCDFQMVGSGYEEKDPWYTMHIPKTPKGTKAVGGGTKMTYRYYLQDARFGVVLDLENELAIKVSEALMNPCFDIYLGRKNCVPTDFIYRGIFSTLEDAEVELSRISSGKELSLDFIVSNEDSPDKGEVLTLNDIPLQFGIAKKYRDRRVTVITL